MTTAHLEPVSGDPGAERQPARARRRTVVAAAGLTGVAVAVPTSLRLLPDLLSGAAAAPRRLDRSAFVPHVGAAFDAVLDGETRRLELVEVSDLDPSVAPAGDPDTFAVRFRSRDPLVQGTYDLSRRGFAPAAVFLVPGAADRAGTASAVFVRAGGGAR